MNIAGWIASLVKPASDIGKAYVEGKQKIQQAKIYAELAKWVAKAQSYENDAERTHNWEIEALKMSQYSWKDELWTIVLALLLVAPMGLAVAGVFTGSVVYTDAIIAMWNAYAGMPIVLQGLYPVAILASMGIRWKGKREAADAIKKLG